MRQLATGAEGAGYEIMYTAKDMPDDLQKTRAELMQVPPTERGTPDFKAKVDDFNLRVAEWQKAGPSTVAHLIVDGVLKGEYPTGDEARSAAMTFEQQSVGHSPALADWRWRTE